MPTMTNAVPTLSTSPERSVPRIFAAMPAVAMDVEKYASVRPMRTSPMYANAFGHVGCFMTSH